MSGLIQSLKIGEIAHESGLPIKTIRYYDEIGLLTPMVERSNTGYRLFNPDVLDRLAFIRHAQTLGLSLTEVKEILTVHDRGQLPCETVKQQIQDKVERITEQIKHLEALRHDLQSVLRQWQEDPTFDESTICPNLEAAKPTKAS